MSHGLIELTAAELDMVAAGHGFSRHSGGYGGGSSGSGGQGSLVFVTLSNITGSPVIQLTINLTLLSNNALASSTGGSASATSGGSTQLGTSVARFAARLLN